MSQALGAFCDIHQDVTSWNYTEGAAVALEMEEYERERDQCPMHFDDGSNPWMQTENYIKVFTYGYWGSSPATGLSDRFKNAFSLFCVMQLKIALFRYAF